MDFETQRKNMVESQIRPSDVTDRRIIRAMAEVPRERFLPQAMRSVAYIDADVPVTAPGAPHPRALLAPRTFAKLVQLAEIDAGDVVLDVGAATGYSAAVLARLAQTVVALESDDLLAREARRTLAGLSEAGVSVVTGDLTLGQPQEGPYDAIVVEGALTEAPAVLIEQLKDGGRLVAVLAGDGARDALGKAVVWRRRDGTLGEARGFDAAAPILPGFERKPEFAF